MSKEPEALLFFEDFLAFLREKKINPDCLSCNTQRARWLVMGLPNRGDETTPAPSLIYGTLNQEGAVDDITVAGDAMVTSTCQNCGNVRLYSYKKILEWKRGTQAAQSVEKTQTELPRVGEHGGD